MIALVGASAQIESNIMVLAKFRYCSTIMHRSPGRY
eukprot:COSAG02_NODE_66034_length_256_cov_0.987261_1_plen_35_part_01